MLDTIVALSTAPMKSAIAVIRVSGEDSYEIVSKVFDKNLCGLSQRNVCYGHIVNDGEVIDEVVVINYVKPHSFTGENCVEIMTHGSLIIVDEIIELLISNGARLATRGEFTSRAYMNKKIDLIQAEAINDVINSTSKEAKKLSLMSLEGKTTKLLEPIKTLLADLMANIEVNIDYPEYQDIEEVNVERIINDGNKMIDLINKLILEGEQGEKIKEGISVAIVGKPNVGKSSLLNALLKEDKAIVTDIAGTTRDIVEGDVLINGLMFHLFDTAGIRESKDVVENIGINKAKKTIKEADIVVVVLDAQRELDKEDLLILEETKEKNPLIVYNKCDIKNVDGKINISARENKIDKLIEELIKKTNISEESFNRPSLNNARQIGLLKKTKQAIEKVVEDGKNGLPVDLLAVSLFEAYNAILSIMGEKADPDISKEIFSRFCVGK